MTWISLFLYAVAAVAAAGFVILGAWFLALIWTLWKGQ